MMEGEIEKTVLITGCNVGIGKETVKQIAKLNYRIIMACRNTEQATAAKGLC
jgi:NAD(P)-dependent dehydrogenase (short-subunit alcohol dehydrogenase family)